MITGFWVIVPALLRIKLLHVFRGFANVMSHFAKEDDQNGVVDATGVWGNKLY